MTGAAGVPVILGVDLAVGPDVTAYWEVDPETGESRDLTEEEFRSRTAVACVVREPVSNPRLAFGSPEYVRLWHAVFAGKPRMVTP